MQPYKRIGKGATLALFAAGLMATGGVASIGMQAFAQTSTASNTPIVTTQAPAQDIADTGKDAQDENVALPTGGISETQARAAITAKYPGVAIQRIELEKSDSGAVVYGAKLADKTEVTVDAKTGVVAQEPADQEGVEHQDGASSGKDANEAPGTETNDGPGGQNEAGETGQN